MAAFRRMLQVGVKTENCLMRYFPLKGHSTSSSSSSREFVVKKMHSELINMGFTEEEAKKIGTISMALYDGLEIKSHSLLEKIEIHNAEVELDSKIDERERQICKKQEEHISLLKDEIRDIHNASRDKMNSHVAALEKMVGEMRLRASLADEEARVEAFRLWKFGTVSIVTAGIASVMLLRVV